MPLSVENGRNNIHIRPGGLAILLLSTAVLLGGCAVYHHRPLPDHAALPDAPDALRIDASRLHIAGLKNKKINLSDGLDMTEIAILAVLNNPDLTAQRARRAVAGAQLFAAGLLPDPQLSVSLDHPTNDVAGAMNGWGLGLGYDILPLITRQARINAETNAGSRLDLDLLWQEWQVAQQARSLYIRYQSESRRLALLKKTRALYRRRYAHSARALAQGNLTLDVSGTDLTALMDISSQINQLQQSHNETCHNLNLLLGLSPGVSLTLSPWKKPAALDRPSIKKGLATLSRRRPDLLALQAGYRSREAKVRAAVLAQFPSLSIGFNRARDTGGLYTNGFGINLNLPLFSGNRGAIAVERATRDQLRTEYQARLDQALSDVDRLVELQNIVTKQQQTLNRYLPKLQKMVKQAQSAYRKGDIDALTFLNMETTWVNKRLEEIDLEQSQWDNRIALETLLAWPDSSLPRAAAVPAKRTNRNKGNTIP